MNLEASAVESAIPLSDATLRVHERRIEVPIYDRSALRPSIVHFGVGGFHRAHQAVYLDELAQLGSTDCGVIGVCMRHRTMREALMPQDWLYTVAERGDGEERARAVGVLREVLFAPDDPNAVVEAMADPATTIVSLTITGGAYESEPSGPELASDVFAFIVEALARRRRAGLPPFTVLSCDNVPMNGVRAREAVLRWAAARDRGLARWIESEAAFPSSVVDRIVPKTTPEARRFVRDRFGIFDRWPVIAEPYSQWILEDDFSAGRPALEDAGVQLVPDVAAYQLMKKRLLNGGHCALGYVGLLAGHERTDEAMDDPMIRDYLRSLLCEEIAPLLDEVPGIDLDDYIDTLLERFANPGIGDQLSRLAERGSVKMPSYLLPSAAEAQRHGFPDALLAVAVAAWIRCLRGTDLDGRRLRLGDPLGERLGALARAGGTDPRPVLRDHAVFGDLGRSPAFVAAVERNLRALERAGIAGMLSPTAPAPVPMALR